MLDGKESPAWRRTRPGAPATREEVSRAEPTWLSDSRAIVRTTGAVAVLVGGLFLALWFAGIAPRLPAGASVKTNLALGLALAGTALFLLGGRGTTRRLRALAAASSTLVLLLGALTMIEHLFGVDLRVDQLLATEPTLWPGVANPNRMGPPAALGLTLLGAGLLLLAGRRRGAAFLGVAVCFIVLLPGVGYLYGVGPLHESARVTGIAWPGVLVLFSLGLGLSVAWTGAGPPLFWRKDAGGVLFRRLVVPAVLAPPVIGYFRLMGERAGLYERLIGTGIFAVSLSLVFYVLVWRTADRLSTAAAEREAADRRARDALRESEERYRTLFTTMVEGFTMGEVILDGEGRPTDVRFLEVNDAFLRQTGLRRGDVLGRPLRTVLPHLEQEWVDAACAVALSGQPARLVQRSRDLSGTFSVYLFRPVPGRFAGIFVDVTERERVQAERDLLAQQARVALDAARLGWWQYDQATDSMAYDARYGEIFGVSGERRQNQELLKLIHPEDLSRVWAAVTAALDPVHAASYAVEYRIIRPDGELRWIEAHGLVRFEGEGAGRRASSFEGTVSDITERKRAAEALRESTALLRTVSDTVPDPLFAKDRRGRMIFANPATLRAIGKSAEQVLGRTELEWLEDPVQAHAILANDRAIMEAGEPRIVEEVLRTPEGDRVFLGSKSPLRAADGRVVGIVGMGRDITERKHMEEALREADRRKDDFLGMLSHELRNPLAPIRNALFLLDHAQPASEQALRARAVAHRQVAHLTRLVDDLLDVTRIARGKIQLRRTPLDLGALARRTAEDHRALLQERGVELTLGAPAEPVMVNGDETRLVQVLGNILQNAAKFTPSRGRVDVRAGVEEGRAVVRVRDTGAGIEPALLRSMFEPFTQGKQTLARSEGGLGLGLALVKALVELHGGEVSARSNGPGSGTELVVSLPLVAPAAVRAAPGPLLVAEGARPRRRVLVVDDNRDAAETLAQLVEMFGHEAEVAYDGPSAVTKACENPPDIVLCDIGLPGMDGYSVARSVRASCASRTRLFAVSGYAQPEDVARAEAAGFDGHIPKPADPSAIEELLS